MIKGVRGGNETNMRECLQRWRKVMAWQSWLTQNWARSDPQWGWLKAMVTQTLEKFVPVENTERLDTGLLSTLPRFINGCWRHHVLWLSYIILQRVKLDVLKMTHIRDCSTSSHSTHISGIFVWNVSSIFFTFTFICGMIFHFESQAHSVSIFKRNETFFLLTSSCAMFYLFCVFLQMWTPYSCLI